MANNTNPLSSPEQWDALDKQYRAPLMAFFVRRVFDHAEAEDLTQEVFIRIARHPHKQNEKNAYGYVFMIAANLLKDWGRHRTVRQANRHRSLSQIPENVGVPRPLVEEFTPERVLSGRENLKCIESVLLAMSERRREIFVLSRLENMNHRDIAVRFGISVSAVEKHVMKAIAAIAERVEEVGLDL